MKEFELIDFIKNYFDSNFIGDDAFFYNNLLVSKDILIENVHFILDNNFYEIGAKSIISNISDILAMGGKPKFFFLGLGIPNRIKDDEIKSFLKGVKDYSLEYNVKIGGGDISLSLNDFFVSITVVGEVINVPIQRNKAKVGDYIFVVGEVGDSEIGLKIIKKEFFCENSEYFVRRHYIKKLYPDFIYELVRNNYVNSMIDISDGFLQDLEHILKTSKKGAEIFATKIPVSNYYKKIKKILGEYKFLEIVLTSGEEYGLIFTSPKKYVNKILELGRKFNVPIANVGKVIDYSKEIIIKDFNKKLEKKGYIHF